MQLHESKFDIKTLLAIVVLTAFAAGPLKADQAVQGRDSSGVAHTLKTDTNGQLYIANPGSGGGGGGGSTSITDSTGAYYLNINSSGQIQLSNWPSNPATSTAQATAQTSFTSMLAALNSLVTAINAPAQDATLTGGSAKFQQYDGTNVIGTTTHPVQIALPAATVTTLTPPAAITGFATSANQTNGTQESQIYDGSNVIGTTAHPVQVALPSATVTTLTPPTSVTCNAGTNLNTSALATAANQNANEHTDLTTISSNQTNNSQTTKITDGTNSANVSTTGAQSGQNYVEVGQTYETLTITATTAGTSTVYDVRGYSRIACEQTATYTGETSVAWETAGTSTATLTSFYMQQASSNVGAGSTLTNTTTNLFSGNIPGPYFALLWGGAGTSGTGSVTCTLWTGPVSPTSVGVNAAQSGTWTVQPGNTNNTTPWLVFNGAASTGGWTYTHISTSATTTIKSGAGTLHAICVNTPGTTETATVYDSTTGSGTVIGVLDDTDGCKIYDAAVATGITVVTAGTTAGDETVLWK